MGVSATRIMTTTPILTGEITINELLGCAWIREARAKKLTDDERRAGERWLINSDFKKRVVRLP